VLDSWQAFPGNGGSEPHDYRGAAIQVLLVTHGIVEIAVGLMLSLWKHGRAFGFDKNFRASSLSLPSQYRTSRQGCSLAKSVADGNRKTR